MGSISYTTVFNLTSNPVVVLPLAGGGAALARQ